MLGGLYHFMQKIVFSTIQFERHLQEIFILEPLQRIELLKNSSPPLILYWSSSKHVQKLAYLGKP